MLDTLLAHTSLPTATLEGGSDVPSHGLSPAPSPGNKVLQIPGYGGSDGKDGCWASGTNKESKPAWSSRGGK